jgi:hypothetical protein
VIELGVQLFGWCPELGDDQFVHLFIRKEGDVALQFLKLFLPINGQRSGPT